MNLTYQQAVTKLAAIEEEVDTTSTRLAALRLGLARSLGIPSEGKFGLVPEQIRTHTEYRYAKKAYDKAFQKLRDMNAYLNSEYRAEHRLATEAARDARRAEALAQVA